MNKNTGYKQIFKNFQYMKLFSASMVNRFGDSVDAIASAWIIYELTGSAMWSAILYGVNKLPSVVIAPFAGAWVEGMKKKPVMILTDLIRAVCVAVIATGILFGFLTPWILLATTLTISTAEAFRLPAGSALIPRLLSKEELSYGMSLSTSMGTVVELIGTGAAAGIIALIGTAGAIYLDMTTFILSALIIATIKVQRDEATVVNSNAKAYFETLKQGFSYISRSKVAMFLVAFAAFLNGITVPINSLQAPLVSEILKGGPETLSLLGIAVMVGTLVGSVAYPILIGKVRKEVFVIGGGFALGLYYLGLIMAQPLYTVPAFMYVFVGITSFILGLFIALLSAFLNVQFMEMIEEQYLARAASIMNAMGSAVTPVMSLVVTGLAAVLPISVIFVIMGLLDLAVCLYIALTRTVTMVLKSEESADAA